MDVTLYSPSLPAHFSERAREDYQLVQTAISGCQKAYATLLRRYRPVVFQLMFQRTRNAQDAADLTMEAFGKAFRKLAAYAPTHAFSTWLMRIALNNCIDHARRKRVRIKAAGDSGGEHLPEGSLLHQIPTEAPGPEEQLIRLQRIGVMQNLLRQLSPEHQAMIDMRYYQDLSYEEMAGQLQLPLGTVKARLHRAKEALYKKAVGCGALQ